DRLERLALIRGGALVQVEDPAPRGARLVVAVAGGERHRQPGEVSVACGALLDQPRQDSQALAVGRAPARHAVDLAARADRVAVARLEVRAADSPAHPVPCCAGMQGSCALTTLPVQTFPFRLPT